MTDPSIAEAGPETPIVEKAQETREQRWLKRLLAKESFPQLKRALEHLPPRRIAAEYRKRFTAQEAIQSFGLVRTKLQAVTGEVVLEHLARIEERRPDVVVHLASIFLVESLEAMETLLTGGVPEGVSSDELLTLRWLLEDDLSTEETSTGLTQALTALQQARAALETERAQHLITRRQLDDRLPMEQRLQQRLERVELEGRERIAGIVRRHEEALKQKEVQAQLHRQRDGEAQTRARERLKAQMTDLQSQLEQRQVDEAGDAFRQVRELRQMMQRERDDAERRRAQLQRQQASQHQQIRQLQDELSVLNEAALTPVLELEQLEQALILQYEQLGETPTERLLGLFTAYRAFLDGHAHPLLDEASNLAALTGKAPSGILLLGLERLLEDGANLPLARFMRSRIFQQEASLHDLIEHVDAPRLRVPS